ncbi:MAG: tRNA (5-methylaminomethyl-2-thiouridine)(34)-methyltransferase MnmD [Bacteroidaceae bacterium]|nr:tRNA (5-methylaminomethyl-2-thiouridine)(34)-methyltransferase MnmD [Bacteroidaceae bacterium]
MDRKTSPLSDVTLVATEDGSLTMLSPYKEEHYHSMKGAYTESMHIYIGCGLQHFIAENHPSSVRIFEVGFGTGLNAYLSCLAAEEKRLPLHYTSIELYPLSVDVAQQLHYDQLFPTGTATTLSALLQAPWGCFQPITPHFHLFKLEADLLAWQGEQAAYDVIYFDAFSPESQPELWTIVLFEKLYASLAVGGSLVTYCAKGVVRRRLQQVGFVVERLAGPPNGKREILRGRKF